MANIFQEAGKRRVSVGYVESVRSSISSASTLGSGEFSYEQAINELQEDKYIDPLTKRKLVWMSLCIFSPNIFLIAVFSTMGKGENLYNAVANQSTTGDALLCFATLVAVFMLIFDWLKIENKIWKAVSGLFPAVIFYLGAVCKGRKYPWAGIIATLALGPTGLGYLHLGPLKGLKRQKFYGATAALSSFSAVAIAVMFWYYMYVSPKRIWNQETKYELVEAYHEVYKHVYKERPLDYHQDCGPNKNETMLDALELDVKESIDFGCKTAATLWFLSFWCPFIAIGWNVTVAIFCHATGTVTREVHSQQRVLVRFILVLTFLLAGMYACATMSASSLRLGSTLLAFFFSGIVLLCIWLWIELDHDQILQASKQSKLMQQFVEIIKSDWARAMGLGFVAIPLLVLLSLSCCTNIVRKKRNIVKDEDRDKDLTPTGQLIVRTLLSWNLTSIFLKIAILGELFFTLQVGVAKVTYIFLSWLNFEVLKDVSFYSCAGLVFIIGGTMFLLPPVPGLPVYVFAGILLGEKGRQDESIGFAMAICIASAVSLFTKLVACTGQYMIGYYLGRSLKVQQLIGVDKVPTRAIEMVLKTRGLHPGKVAILVGGPDWPTSVTCGIIRVNIPQMLLGTIPVLILLVPCILAGACLARVTPGEDSEWNMMASGATALAAVINMGGMAYAVFTISQTIQAHGHELAQPRKEHEAIAALTRQEAEFNEFQSQKIHWSVLTCGWKFLLLVATIGVYISNAMFVIFAEACFRPFSVSSKIQDSFVDSGLEGDVTNIVIAPLGHFALSMFFISVFFHFYFVKRMSEKAQFEFKELKQGEELFNRQNRMNGFDGKRASELSFGSRRSRIESSEIEQSVERSVERSGEQEGSQPASRQTSPGDVSPGASSRQVVQVSEVTLQMDEK